MKKSFCLKQCSHSISMYFGGLPNHLAANVSRYSRPAIETCGWCSSFKLWSAVQEIISGSSQPPQIGLVDLWQQPIWHQWLSCLEKIFVSTEFPIEQIFEHWQIKLMQTFLDWTSPCPQSDPKGRTRAGLLHHFGCNFLFFLRMVGRQDHSDYVNDMKCLVTNPKLQQEDLYT